MKPTARAPTTTGGTPQAAWRNGGLHSAGGAPSSAGRLPTASHGAGDSHPQAQRQGGLLLGPKVWWKDVEGLESWEMLGGSWDMLDLKDGFLAMGLVVGWKFLLFFSWTLFHF